MDFLSLKFFFFYKKRCSYTTRKGRTCKICKNFTRALTEIDMPMELSGETKKAGISAGRIGLVLALNDARRNRNRRFRALWLQIHPQLQRSAEQPER